MLENDNKIENMEIEGNFYKTRDWGDNEKKIRWK